MEIGRKVKKDQLEQVTNLNPLVLRWKYGQLRSPIVTILPTHTNPKLSAVANKTIIGSIRHLPAQGEHLIDLADP